MRYQFQVGDRVECISDRWAATSKHIGMCGTVRHIRHPRQSIGVEFDERVCDGTGSWYGHNLNDHISSDTGWYVDAKEIRIIEPETICQVDDLL